MKWQRFPIELFPECARMLAVEAARALPCDPAMIALPMLIALGAAIGSTRYVQVKRGWIEYPILWGMIIARPSAMKSPAFTIATEPSIRYQHEQLLEYQKELYVYRREKATYEKQKTKWKGDGDPPEEPKPPPEPRLVASDTTIEALAVILLENPRGVLVANNELSAWVSGIGQYKARGGADKSRWIELYDCGNLIVDRKTGSPRSIVVARASASVVGTIQPGVCKSLFTGEDFDSGFMSRFLLAHPPEHLPIVNRFEPTQSAIQMYEYAVRRLLIELQHDDGDAGPTGRCLKLSKPAFRRFTAWQAINAKRAQDAATDALNAVYGKLKGTALRIALIFQLVDDPTSENVEIEAMERGCNLADWFAYETERIYERLSETRDERELRTLVETIDRRGGIITPRELNQNLKSKFPTVEDARLALQQLADAGFGEFGPKPMTSAGGRPSEYFALNDEFRTSNYETPTNQSEKQGFVGDDELAEFDSESIDNLHDSEVEGESDSVPF